MFESGLIVAKQNPDIENIAKIPYYAVMSQGDFPDSKENAFRSVLQRRIRIISELRKTDS